MDGELRYRRGDTWSLRIEPCSTATTEQKSLANRMLRFMVKIDPSAIVYAIDYSFTFPDTAETQKGIGTLIIPRTLTWILPGQYYVEVKDQSTDATPVVITMIPDLSAEYAILTVLPTLETPP